MVETISRIEDYARVGYEEVIKDQMRRDAIERNLIKLGDAASNITQALRQKSPEVDWKRWVGLCIIYSHQYTTIDPRRMWSDIAELPRLRQQVEALLYCSYESLDAALGRLTAPGG